MKPVEMWLDQLKQRELYQFEFSSLPIDLKDFRLLQKANAEGLIKKVGYKSKYSSTAIWKINDDKYISPSGKMSRKCRNKELRCDTNSGKAYLTKILASKMLNVSTCFNMTDNFEYPTDLIHENLGKIKVRSSSLNNSKGWQFVINRNKEPDNFICIGYDERRKHVMIVLIFPSKIISHKTALIIPPNMGKKYLIYVQDPNPWDGLYQKITSNLEKCPVLKCEK